ncbi:MAG: hypothetical protein HQ536_01030 [Parcubacteria group bacterium]|nr:hypothetical protein [Parcubacteria group bacterium]
MRVITTFLLLICLVVGLFPYSASAFTPNFIISDEELADYNSMSLLDIQNFLQIKNSRLAYYYADDVDGGVRTAAEVIWRAARNYEISPRVLLVTLQKEQSLVENPNPSQYNLDWATGYARCDDYDSCGPNQVPEHKGFAKQVDDAAGWYRWYLNGNASWLKKPGVTYDIDGHSVTPANLATASLYAYTPHWNGNLNFWTIYNRWFSRNYPEGSLLKISGENTSYYLRDGKIRPIKSLAIIFSRFRPENIITVKPSDLENFEEGPELKFTDYTLLRSPKGTIYLTIGDSRRGIRSMDAFREMGFNMNDVINVDWYDINSYTEGEPITVGTTFPIGRLMQDSKTGGVYFVEDGVKHPIWSREVLDRNYSDYKMHSVSPAELDKIETGSPVKFKDGELVKSFDDSKVYVISDGMRRPIASEKAFLEMGWKWENIVSTNKKTIELHQLGNTIEAVEARVELASS